MPCLNAKDVIFLTNKWDTIKGEVNDEEERNKTWEIIQGDIKRYWRPVKDENIFRMNLTEVFTKGSLFTYIVANGIEYIKIIISLKI